MRCRGAHRTAGAVAIVAALASMPIPSNAGRAATLGGTLHCRDGGPLPATVDLRVVAAADRPAGMHDHGWQRQVLLAHDGRPLSGAARNRFTTGPLPRARTALAIRPSGFDRWTWAPGTEHGAEASVFDAAPRRARDIGRIAIDCAPAIRLVPRLPAGGEPLSLADVGTRDETFRIDGHVVAPDGRRRVVASARVEASAGSVMIRDLPEGAASLRVRVGHRYFLPYRWIDLRVDDRLERGRTVELTLEIDEVGGAIEVVDSTGRAAMVRATHDDGAAHRARLAHGRALLTNLPAGRWRVEACVDDACREAIQGWSEVTLDALSTITLSR